MEYEELNEAMNAMIELAIQQTPGFAKAYKKLYDELIKKGFTEEQAMQIVANYKLK